MFSMREDLLEAYDAGRWNPETEMIIDGHPKVYRVKTTDRIGRTVEAVGESFVDASEQLRIKVRAEIMKGIFTP